MGIYTGIHKGAQVYTEVHGYTYINMNIQEYTGGYWPVCRFTAVH